MNAIEFIDIIDVIQKLIEHVTENVKKQKSCVFIIKMNKNDNFVDVDIDLKVIDETNANLEKRDDFVITFEFIAIVFF